ncbi:transposable element Tcb2 transposase [Trichonephila clavipes]|nr:transposable element Tcb2 transposase [Trichonephila clavipes]
MCSHSLTNRYLKRCPEGILIQGPLKASYASGQNIDGCDCNGLMSTEPGKLIGTKLSFQMNHASICGTMMAAFVLDAMLVNAAFQSALSNDIVALHRELWYVREVLQPEVVPIFQGIPGSIFQQDNARPTCCKDCSRLLFSPTHATSSSAYLFAGYVAIEHVWDLVGPRLARDPRPVASKNELLLRIQAIWNSLQQAGIQNLFDSMPRSIAALIEESGGYTKILISDT